jgi:hypothetical protein
MRKIEKEMINAIRSHKNFGSANTRVRIAGNGDMAAVYLHGNHIASVDYPTGFLCVNKETLARWPSPTTKSRLRALGANVYTRKGVTYLNDQPV